MGTEMKYSEFVQVYNQLEKTSKRLEKTSIISSFLKTVAVDDLPLVTLLLQGKIFPNWDSSDAGLATKLIVKAMSTASGETKENVEANWKQTGDLGKTAEKLFSAKKQATLFSEELTIHKVLDNLRKLATIEGQGSVDRKIALVAELLTSASAVEAKYIVKTVLSELRAGIGEGTIRDSITWAYFGDQLGVSFDEEKNDVDMPDREEYTSYVDAVQYAFDLTNDFGEVAQLAAEKGLKGLQSVKIVVGRPIKAMLALKEESIAKGIERVGVPAEAEFKYDGFRLQVHKTGDQVRLFTRRLDEVTTQFPDVVEAVAKQVKGKEFILDCECVGFDKKTKKYLPFQNISQRIRRKYDIEKMASDFPVELNVFDVLYYEGKNYISEMFEKRLKLLDEIISGKEKVVVHAKHIVTESQEEIEQFYQDALDSGNEGIMLKKLDAVYKPGSRVGHMIKMKPVMDTLDLVIVGAEWGEGKRSAWLSSYLVACRDEEGNLLEVGRVSTGLKEKDEEGLSFSQMTEMLQPLLVEEKGKEVVVKPSVIIEVDYEEIQKSPTYSSGYALRFPRVKGVRSDRAAEDASALSLVEQYYISQ